MKKIKLFLANTLERVSPTLYTKLIYRRVFGKKLNLRNPQGFNEKLLWLIINWKHPLMVRGADKYKMREYVEEFGLGHILPKLYGVYSSSSEINWDVLPDKFVLKCNHGARFNILCKDKSKIDKVATSNKLDNWLEVDYGYGNNQKHYSKIPRKIICEEYLESKDGTPLNEFNIFCFNGVPKVILVYVEGTPHTENEIEFYDINWNPLNLGHTANKSRAKKPLYLERMIEYSRTLSKPFPFVRVDFYVLEDKPILGELTFTSKGGLSKTYTAEGNNVLGHMLTLPTKYMGNYK